LTVFAILFLVALIAFAYVGLFTRYMADDYCYVASVNQIGFTKFQRAQYIGWNGRFSFSFFQAVAGFIGPRIVPFLQLLAITCWLIAATWAIYQLALIAQWPQPLLTAFVIAELIVFSTLNGAYNIVQSVYWQAGMLTYVPPLVCLPLYVGLVLHGTRKRLVNSRALPLVVVSFFLSFIAGGFSEPYSLLQVFGLLLAGTLIYKWAETTTRRAALPFIIAGLAGSVIALIIVVLAPGNKIRQSHFPAPPDLITLTKLSLYYAAGFTYYTLRRSPLTSFLFISLPVFLGYFLNKRYARPAFHWPRVKGQLLLSPVIGYFLIFLCIVPGFYGTSGMLPDRARIIPQFVLVCLAVYWCYFAGAALTRTTILQHIPSWISTAALGGIVAVMIASPLSAALRTFRLARNGSVAASIWDQTDREIRSARERGERNVSVPAVDDVESRLGVSMTELQLERTDQNWKNKCAARYYKVDSITAK
jgi:hypothetical protein